MAEISSELSLEIGKFLKAFQDAENRVKRGKANMQKEGGGISEAILGKASDGLKGAIGAAAGAISVGAMGAFIKSTSDWAQQMQHLANRVNESTESMQRLDYAARQTSGEGVEKVVDSVVELENLMSELDNTNAQDALARLGLSSQELMGLPIEQKILALADGFQKARADGTGMADVMQTLGGSVDTLIPLLSKSREELEALMNEANVVSDLDMENLIEMNRQFDLGVMNLKAFGVEAISAAAGLGKFLYTSMTVGSAAAQEQLADQVLKTNTAEGQRSEQRKAAAKAREDARAAQSIASLRTETGKNAVAMLSPEDQARHLREQLSKSLGLKVNSQDDVRSGLSNLQTEADEARKRGDLKAEQSALQRLKEVQNDAQALSGLSPSGGGGKGAAMAGETASAINSILGRGGQDLVMLETKNQTTLLTKIHAVLESISRQNESDDFGHDLN